MAYVYGYDAATPHFDAGSGYGSWFSRAVSGVSHAVAAVTKPIAAGARALDVTNKSSVLGNFAKTTVGKLVLAPMAIPFATAKATAWVGAQTGIKPLKRLDSDLGRVIKRTPVKGLLQTDAVIAATAGAVAVTIATGGTALPAVIAAAPGAALLATNRATYGGAVSSFLTGAVSGVTAAGALNAIPSGIKQAAPASLPAVAPVATPAIQTLSDTGAPQARASGLGAPAAGAAGGFLLGGPVGAAFGAAAGYLLSRK